MPSGKHGVECRREEDLSRLADGERLPEAQHRRIEGHLERCDVCRAAYQRHLALGTLLKAALGQVEGRASRAVDTQVSHVNREMLGTYLDGGPDTDERARIEQHLARCDECLQELVTLRSTLHRAQNDARAGQGRAPRAAAVDTVRRMMSRHASGVAPSAGATCPSCGGANPDDAQYCGGCGSPLGAGAAARYCLHCSSRVSPTGTFCQSCGRMLGAADQSNPVWPAVVRWVRERRMHYLSLILAVAALFAASFHPFRKYQLYAIAALAAAKWLADVAVNGLVHTLVRADPAARTESAQLRRRQMVTAVLTSLSALIARHAWLLAAGAVFLLSVLARFRPHFAELVIIGTALALKWIINESGVRLALSLLQAWRSRDTDQVERLLAELRRRDAPQKSTRHHKRRAAGK